MPLILRIDVDKPYGCDTFFRKVISKLREDFFFPEIDGLGFLNEVKKFSTLLNKHNIPAIFYFRNCTTPNSELIDFLTTNGHKIGFHAENTKTLETFTSELQTFKNNLPVSARSIHSFTKHGSGYHKLGKNHYAPYEEEKYHDYSQATGTPFYFGNGMLESFKELPNNTLFYKKVFWMEAEYRTDPNMTIENLIPICQNELVPILIHPENYSNRPQTKKDFDLLIELATKSNIKWTAEMI